MAINVEKGDLRERIAELTDGIGVDVVLENTGSVDPIDQSLDIVRKGKVLWAGGGIRGGIVAPVDTYKVIVKGRIQLRPLVIHLYSLEKWEEAFDLAVSSPECLHVAIRP